MNFEKFLSLFIKLKDDVQTVYFPPLRPSLIPFSHFFPPQTPPFIPSFFSFLSRLPISDSNGEGKGKGKGNETRVERILFFKFFFEIVD